MQCLTPINVKDKLGNFHLVPCGKCEACSTNKSAQWYVRLKNEYDVSKSAIFVTLTYSDDHLPIGVVDSHLVANVSRSDVQHYHYKLRKYLGERSKVVKYFLVSEYGPNPLNGWLCRPHYHVVYFNLTEHDSELIKECWKKGFVDVKPVLDARLRYVSGYSIEKLFQDPLAEPNFSLISKGIGKHYIDIYREYHEGQLDRVLVKIDGHSFPMPRYYKEILYSDAQRKVFAKMCQDRADRVEAANLAFVGGDLARLSQLNYEIRSNFVRKARLKRSKKKNL